MGDVLHMPHGISLKGEFSYKGSGYVSLSYWRSFSWISFQHDNTWV